MIYFADYAPNLHLRFDISLSLGVDKSGRLLKILGILKFNIYFDHNNFYKTI